MLRDLIDILSQCVTAIDRGTFYFLILLSLVLGGLCWVACSYYTRLWNKGFHVKLQHHVLCAIAALLTVVFTIRFYAVGNLELIVDEMIDQWSEELTEDDEWAAQTYETAFYTVKDLYPKDFKDVPEPDSEDTYIPFNSLGMQQACIEVYVHEACADFSTMHPFLDKMLSAQPGVSEDEILSDIQDYFRENTGLYPLERAIVIATEHIREGLLEQSPKTVWKTRLILILLFLGVQSIPFGIIGYCAYKDLSVSHGKINYDNFNF